jgi:MYXO-CTERM domain-containing protein
MSLWKVDDKATRELMEAYYDRGIRGCGCDIAEDRHGHSEVWALIVAGLILVRRRSVGDA